MTTATKENDYNDKTNFEQDSFQVDFKISSLYDFPPVKPGNYFSPMDAPTRFRPYTYCWFFECRHRNLTDTCNSQATVLSHQITKNLVSFETIRPDETRTTTDYDLFSGIPVCQPCAIRFCGYNPEIPIVLEGQLHTILASYKNEISQNIIYNPNLYFNGYRKTHDTIKEKITRTLNIIYENYVVSDHPAKWSHQGFLDLLEYFVKVCQTMMLEYDTDISSHSDVSSLNDSTLFSSSMVIKRKQLFTKIKREQEKNRKILQDLNEHEYDVWNSLETAIMSVYQNLKSKAIVICDDSEDEDQKPKVKKQKK